MNTYNIYRNGKLAIKNVPLGTVMAAVGITSGNMSRYMTPNKQYKCKDGQMYYFEFTKPPVHQRRVKADINIDKEFVIPKELSEGWDNMMAAAELIRTGRGRITGKVVKGKWVRYTEEIA